MIRFPLYQHIKLRSEKRIRTIFRHQLSTTLQQSANPDPLPKNRTPRSAAQIPEYRGAISKRNKIPDEKTKIQRQIAATNKKSTNSFRNSTTSPKKKSKSLKNLRGNTFTPLLHLLRRDSSDCLPGRRRISTENY